MKQNTKLETLYPLFILCIKNKWDCFNIPYVFSSVILYFILFYFLWGDVWEFFWKGKYILLAVSWKFSKQNVTWRKSNQTQAFYTSLFCQMQARRSLDTCLYLTNKKSMGKSGFPKILQRERENVLQKRVLPPWDLLMITGVVCAVYKDDEKKREKKKTCCKWEER